MLFSTHATVGAALGVATGNPILGFLAGAASHHVLDAIPHFDQGTFYIIKPGPSYLGRIREPYETSGFDGNTCDWMMLFIDWGVALVIFGVIFYIIPPEKWPSVIIGALGGILPDVIDSSPLWSRELREKIKVVASYHSFHLFFHWTVEKRNIFLGSATQITAIALSLLYLLK